MINSPQNKGKCNKISKDYSLLSASSRKGLISPYKNKNKTSKQTNFALKNLSTLWIYKESCLSWPNINPNTGRSNSSTSTTTSSRNSSLSSSYSYPNRHFNSSGSSNSNDSNASRGRSETLPCFKGPG